MSSTTQLLSDCSRLDPTARQLEDCYKCAVAIGYIDKVLQGVVMDRESNVEIPEYLRGVGSLHTAIEMLSDKLIWLLEGLTEEREKKLQGGER